MPLDLTPAEKVALDYCAPRGIPLSVFLGRVVGHGESLWQTRDTQAAIWWLQRENDRCPGCGHPRSECMAEDGPSYEAEMLRCYGCQATAAKSAQVSRNSKEDHTAGYGAYFVARKVEDGDVADGS